MGLFLFSNPFIRPYEIEKEVQVPISVIPYETKLKILVAEDDSISLKFISKILKIFEKTY
jgi:hypothetical protein